LKNQAVGRQLKKPFGLSMAGIEPASTADYKPQKVSYGPFAKFVLPPKTPEAKDGA